MKLIGMGLIVLCSWMTGNFLASRLTNRVLCIEKAIELLENFCDRLKFLQPSVYSLIESACKSTRFEDTLYLQNCFALMQQGELFSTSWKKSLVMEQNTLGKQETELLVGLGDMLGCTDLQSQLNYLDYTCELLNERLKKAREDKEKHTKLYQTLGALAGIGIVIVMA